MFYERAPVNNVLQDSDARRDLSITSAGRGPRSPRAKVAAAGRRLSVSLRQSEHFTCGFSSRLLCITEVLNMPDVTPELSRTGRTHFTPTHVAPFFFVSFFQPRLLQHRDRADGYLSNGKTMVLCVSPRAFRR